MPGLAREYRRTKLSPETEARIESAAQEREAKHGTMFGEQRENYKAVLRYLVSLTLAYDA